MLPSAPQVTTGHFRPNFVVNGVRAHEEDSWRSVTFGGCLRFRVTGPCSRYVFCWGGWGGGREGVPPRLYLNRERRSMNAVWMMGATPSRQSSLCRFPFCRGSLRENPLFFLWTDKSHAVIVSCSCLSHYLTDSGPNQQSTLLYSSTQCNKINNQHFSPVHTTRDLFIACVLVEVGPLAPPIPGLFGSSHERRCCPY